MAWPVWPSALAVLGRPLLLAGAAGDSARRGAVVRDIPADRAVLQGHRPGVEVDAAAIGTGGVAGDRAVGQAHGAVVADAPAPAGQGTVPGDRGAVQRHGATRVDHRPAPEGGGVAGERAVVGGQRRPGAVVDAAAADLRAVVADRV